MRLHALQTLEDKGQAEESARVWPQKGSAWSLTIPKPTWTHGTCVLEDSFSFGSLLFSHYCWILLPGAYRSRRPLRLSIKVPSDSPSVSFSSALWNAYAMWGEVDSRVPGSQGGSKQACLGGHLGLEGDRHRSEESWAAVIGGGSRGQAQQDPGGGHRGSFSWPGCQPSREL